ncbi:hypothetical protein FA15DRAFT_116375 [Coprinopsis marcescibilis]|uniref:Uncharacterized protein n=1 Tax=Coprinopsis marcescibilis TaxID=230819 RepID=A0A5C3KKA8_COPMA|nr:hypothetical protein FA15DRAFT_116375 [Coprinopsis marcescibilis]
MLLGEVGKLRENRRALQHEIGFLLTMQSKYGPGGEFDPEWRPAPGGPGGPGGPPGDQPPPPPDVPEGPPEVPIARPGWRPVNPVKKKKKRQQQQQQQQQQQAPPPAAASIHEHLTGRTALPQRPVALSPRSQVRSWQAWLRKWTFSISAFLRFD